MSGFVEDIHERFKVCPFDKSHIISNHRFPYHLTKCRKNHKHSNLIMCPYDASEYLEPQKISQHLLTCKRRNMLLTSTNNFGYSVGNAAPPPPDPIIDRGSDAENWSDEDEEINEDGRKAIKIITEMEESMNRGKRFAKNIFGPAVPVGRGAGPTQPTEPTTDSRTGVGRGLGFCRGVGRGVDLVKSVGFLQVSGRAIPTSSNKNFSNEAQESKHCTDNPLDGYSPDTFRPESPSLAENLDVYDDDDDDDEGNEVIVDEEDIVESDFADSADDDDDDDSRESFMKHYKDIKVKCLSSNTIEVIERGKKNAGEHSVTPRPAKLIEESNEQAPPKSQDLFDLDSQLANIGFQCHPTSEKSSSENNSDISGENKEYSAFASLTSSDSTQRKENPRSTASLSAAEPSGVRRYNWLGRGRSIPRD